MTARNRVATAARWLKVAQGRAQLMARRRTLIAALVDARRAEEGQPDDVAGEPWDEGPDDEPA